MTYYGGRELAASFRTVRGNTITIAEEIPESSYHFKVSDDSRTIGQTLAHIAMVAEFQTHVHQNHFDDLKKVDFRELMQRLGAEESKPRTKAEIIALLKTSGEKFAAYLEDLSESFLAERVALQAGAEPASKSRFEMLLTPKEHEMHHRGQLMVMQRMIGLTPHLTRQRRERMAAQAAAAQPAQR
jgi:uncharacterized damage-inducible protein DinB